MGQILRPGNHRFCSQFAPQWWWNTPSLCRKAAKEHLSLSGCPLKSKIIWYIQHVSIFWAFWVPLAPKNCPGAASRPWGLPPGIHPQPCRGPNPSPGAGASSAAKKGLNEKRCNTHLITNGDVFSGLVSLPERYHEKMSNSTTKKLSFYQQECGIPSRKAAQQQFKIGLRSHNLHPQGKQEQKLRGMGKGWGWLPPLLSSRTAGGQTLQTFGKVSTRDLPLLAIKPMAKNHGFKPQESSEFEG